ncbi:hypothetical protein MHOCP_16630 [Moorella humiferrea]|uniref:CAP domain-containing protein n=1 Tax=Neomoorella humiferrea TaxID=676965 RepID=UPI0030D25A78
MRFKVKIPTAYLIACLVVAVLVLTFAPLPPVQAATYSGNYYAFHFAPLKYLYSRYAQPQPAPLPAPAPKPVPVPAPQPEPQNENYQLHEFEQKVVDLVNAERAKAGLKPLTLDIQLARVARLKAEDMRDNNYFSHESPTYGSFFTMLQKFGITYRTAGENIAAGYQTPEAVVAAWMGSPGHRNNILNPNFTSIGVGYTMGGSYRNYWVQLFIGK